MEQNVPNDKSCHARKKMSVDRLHNLALEIAQEILAARTEAEYGEVGVKAKNFAPTEDLIELAKQLMAEENRRLTLQSRDYVARQTGAVRRNLG